MRVVGACERVLVVLDAHSSRLAGYLADGALLEAEGARVAHIDRLVLVGVAQAPVEAAQDVALARQSCGEDLVRDGLLELVKGLRIGVLDRVNSGPELALSRHFWRVVGLYRVRLVVLVDDAAARAAGRVGALVRIGIGRAEELVLAYIEQLAGAGRLVWLRLRPIHAR